MTAGYRPKGQLNNEHNKSEDIKDFSPNIRINLPCQLANLLLNLIKFVNEWINSRSHVRAKRMKNVGDGM